VHYPRPHQWWGLHLYCKHIRRTGSLRASVRKQTRSPRVPRDVAIPQSNRCRIRAARIRTSAKTASGAKHDRKRSRSPKKLRRDDESKRSHHALRTRSALLSPALFRSSRGSSVGWMSVYASAVACADSSYRPARCASGLDESSARLTPRQM
jgi:hypothetical protein